jgi:hypothetical protein
MAQLDKGSGFANCQEHADIVIDRLIAYGFRGTAEIYCIKGAERPGKIPLFLIPKGNSMCHMKLIKTAGN